MSIKTLTNSLVNWAQFQAHIKDRALHGSKGSILPAGTDSQTLRYEGTVLGATSNFKLNDDGAETTIDHSDGTLPRVVNIVYDDATLVDASTVPEGTLGLLFGAGAWGNVRYLDVNSLSIGLGAGNAWVAQNIYECTAIGFNSQYTNNWGTYLTTLGVRSLASLTVDVITNYSVIAIGVDTGFGIAECSDEIYIGDRILLASNPAGTVYGNIIIGHDILTLTETFNASDNIIIGHDLMQSAPMTTATQCIILAQDPSLDALDTGQGIILIGSGFQLVTSGSYNTGIGNYVGNLITTGEENTLIGDNAGANLEDASSYCLCIGNGSGPLTADEYTYKMWIDMTATDTPLIYADFSTLAVTINGDLDITGALSKGSGTFKIDHPILEGKKLYHGFVEAPEYGLIYRGSIKLKDGKASINIDEACGMTSGTFNAIAHNTTIQLQNRSNFHALLPSIENEILTIISENPFSDALVDWHVYAERKDRFIIDSKTTDDNGHLILER
jgi:hypothetical protein